MLNSREAPTARHVMLQGISRILGFKAGEAAFNALVQASIPLFPFDLVESHVGIIIERARINTDCRDDNGIWNTEYGSRVVLMCRESPFKLCPYQLPPPTYSNTSRELELPYLGRQSELVAILPICATLQSLGSCAV